MLKMIGVSFALALQNIRDNFFHTVLSVLGIVIGVAALVAILSFIDGIEQYTREQISATSSLQSIIVNTNTGKTVDGVRMQKEEWGYFNAEQLKKLEESLSYPATAYLFVNRPQVISLAHKDSTAGILLTGATAELAPKVEVLAGRLFTEEEQVQQNDVAVLNNVLAKKLTGTEELQDAIGRTVVVKEKELRVIGVVKAEREEIAPFFFLHPHPIYCFTSVSVYYYRLKRAGC